jgi:hypothetical protein
MYVKMARDVRKRVSLLTLQQERQILKLYEKALEDLAREITKTRAKTLTHRQLTDFQKELKKARTVLRRQIELQTTSSIKKASELGTGMNEKLLRRMFVVGGLDPGEHFTTIFSRINKDIVDDIISGKLYMDGKSLSARIWNFDRYFDGQIQEIINKGILEGKSAVDLAKDLERFVNAPARRPTDWGDLYPRLKNARVDYNAKRFARTAINHSYQTASIKSSGMNPFVEGTQWLTSGGHNVCEICADREGQIFPNNDVPLDHPNGACIMVPYITKDFDQVGAEINRWLTGKDDNPMLDDWYGQYGDYFANKK